MPKNEIQKQAVKAIIKNNGKGILSICTGAGKSKIAIDYLKIKNYQKIALIVPTEKLRDENWKQEFIKWEAEHLWKNTTRICYASASKIHNKDFDICILDEGHNITPLSQEFFLNNNVNDILCLTATYPEKQEKRDLLKQIGLKEIFSLKVDEAVQKGIIAPYNITVLYTHLDKVNKNIQGGNKNRHFMTTEDNMYQYADKRYRQTLENYATDAKKAFFIKQAALYRMRVIYNLKSKTQAAKRLIDKIQDIEKRTLIFCATIEQALEVYPKSFHSQGTDKNFNDFIKGKINTLSCVKRLNEGHNIPDLDRAIIVQLNSNEKDAIQRIGRILRYRKGHKAEIFILCCKETKDEAWVNNALKSFDINNITYKNFEDYVQQKNYRETKTT